MATYQKVIQLKSSDKEDAEFVSYTVKRRIANEKIKHAMEKVKDVYNRMEEELIQAKKERTLARNNLVHAIYGVQVGELPEEKDISDVLKNVSRSSIFNEHGGSNKVRYNADPPTEPTCGGAGENGAGFTLINDFYCLCVGKDNEKKVCHEKIKGPGKWKLENDCKKCEDCCEKGTCCCCCEGDCARDCKCGTNCKCDKPCDCKENCKCQNGNCKVCSLEGDWMKMKNETDNELEFEEGWPHIRKVCNETFTEKINTTAESIQEVLDGFNKLLAGNNKTGIQPKEAEIESRRLFVLGYLNEMRWGQGCKGRHKHSQQGDVAVCVNYWSVSNLGIGIVWQNYMLEARKHLQAMQKHIQKAQQLSTMIQKLKESAEENYRKSGHGSLLWSEDYGPRDNIWHHFFIFFACLV